MHGRGVVAFVVTLACGARVEAGERFEIRLGGHLGLGELRLAGPRATTQVEFPWPVDWKPLPGAELRLRLSHAPALDGERSFLVVSLNHGLLRSFRLEDANATKAELVLPVAPEMLRAANQLVLTAEQFVVGTGQAQPWTAISAETSLSIPYERKTVAWSLDDLPAPLLRRDSFEPARLAVVLPVRPGGATLEAAARSVAALAAGVAPARVDLSFPRSLREADAPVLLVGTPREQPDIGTLGLPVSDLTAKARPTAGVVVLLPEAGPKAKAALVLTGREPVAIRNAALGLLARRGLEGRTLLVPEGSDGPARPRRAWRGFIPPATSFSVDEAGDPRAELAITADLPGRVRLNAPPDARFLPYGHRVSLAFETLPGAATDAKADLEVFWNEVLVREVSMEQNAHGRRFSLSMPIPASALRSTNLLTLAWNGRSGSAGPFLALRGDASSVVLPREYVATIPDLALLRSSFYPFSLHADLAETVVGIPGSEEAVPALLELAGVFGRLSPSDRFLFRVASLPEAVANGAGDAILLELGDEPSPLELPDIQSLPGGRSLLRLPLVQELARADGRCTLRVRAPTPALLRSAARALGDPAVLERLSGDTAFLAAEGPITFNLAPRRTLSEISYFTRLQAWLRSYWLALPLILAATSSLLFMGLRLVLEYYRSRSR